MARPIKTGLDYFPLDVDFFSDEKIVPISVEFGVKGEIIVIRLLCAIYRNGYFIEWSETVRYRLIKEMPGITGALLDSVVDRLVKWGFFNRDMFVKHHVLTSAAIQHRYFSTTRRRSHRAPVNADYLLIGASVDTQPAKTTPDKPCVNMRKSKADSHDEWLRQFFADSNQEKLLLLCKNFSLPFGDIARLRELADAVVNEWQLTNTSHIDYSDWSRHLVSTMRIKCREEKTAKNLKNNATPPAADDYTYSGGFGSQDI